MRRKSETQIDWVCPWILAHFKSEVRNWNLGLLPLSHSLLSTHRTADHLSMSGWKFSVISVKYKYNSSALRRKLDSCHYGVVLWQVAKITGYVHYWECRLLYHLSDNTDWAYFMAKENYRVDQVSQSTLHQPSGHCTARHDFRDQQLKSLLLWIVSSWGGDNRDTPRSPQS